MFSMKRYFTSFSLIVVVAAFLSVQCVGFGPEGALFTSTTIGVHGTEVGNSAKEGKACAIGILGLVALGDGSVGTAASNGNIQNIHTVNLEGFSVLFLFSQLCTVVRGE